MRKANKLAKGKPLSKGQKLTIPAGAKIPSEDEPESTAAPTPASTAAAEKSAPGKGPAIDISTPEAAPVPAPEPGAQTSSSGDITLRPPSADPVDPAALAKEKAKDKTASTQKPRRKALTHKVGEGETLRSICRKYGVDKDVVYKLSGLKSYSVKYGQTLVIRAADPEPAPARGDDGDDSQSQLATQTRVPGAADSAVADSIDADARKQARDKEKSDKTAASPAPPETPVETPAPGAHQPIPPEQRGKLIQAGTVYTVAGGDTLRKICDKFNVSKEQIRDLNNLSTYNIRLGQVLKITPDVYEVKKERDRSSGMFGLFSSNTSKRSVGSMPMGSSTERHISPPADEPAPGSSSMRLQTTRDSRDTDPTLPPRHDGKLELGTMPVERDASGKPFFPQGLKTWQKQVIREAAWLSRKNIRYCGRFTPPGEAKPWMMDCSNTARLLYKRTTGLDIGRTASDQYYYLNLAQKAWTVPYANDIPSPDFLRRNLRVGDLLFWEHTYKPVRTPPITHVMIFLGYAEDGQMLMAGSQTSSYGSVGRVQSGGPDIYVFNPFKPSGGYRVGRHYQRGRFVAIGRPVTGNVTNTAASDVNAEPGKRRRDG